MIPNYSRAKIPEGGSGEATAIGRGFVDQTGLHSVVNISTDKIQE
jgi:hypothetical protein